MNLSSRLSTWSGRLRQALTATQIGAPLITPEQVYELRQLAQLAHTLPFTRQRETRRQQLGDRHSLIRGSGMDFDDSRPFMAGDDRRYLNWRLYARTGELYLKSFIEEQRPQLCLLLDRRSRMRMGSGDTLKLQEAVKIATTLALLARREQMQVAALLLQSPAQWHKGRGGEAGILELIHAINASAPPLECVQEPSLNDALGQLQESLPTGSIICLISDFMDLDEVSRPLLWQLARKHDLLNFHIVDAMERQLPEAGRMLIESGPGDPPLEVDCNDPGLRQAYAESMQTRQQEIEDLLRVNDASYYVVNEAEDFLSAWLGVDYVSG
ncbi:MAG: DUF58 domain-containing protein [Gammaproteobacteria bacterium]|nr:DUF58 domain-containing protein [Gammaproteobacteria bacterium]